MFPNKSFGQLLDISPKILRTFNLEISYIAISFTDLNSSDLLKNAFLYTIEGMCTALLHMLKYIPGVQEMYEEAVIRNPHKLKFVPDYFKTQKI